MSESLCGRSDGMPLLFRGQMNTNKAFILPLSHSAARADIKNELFSHDRRIDRASVN